MSVELYDTGHHRDKDWLDKFEAENWEKESKIRGIYSVTSDPLNETMWQKYGDEGKGICYGFNTYNFILDTGLKSGGKVNYTQKLPEISPFDEVELQLWKRIYCKEEQWGFEDEYRLGIFGIRQRLVHINDECLEEVILGPNFPPENITFIAEQIKAKGTCVRLFKTQVINKIISIEELQY